ncbi:type II secretion system protein [Caproiciproducens sp.]
MVKTLRKTNKKGFTLVELVIVIVILAILAAIAVPTVSNVVNTAKKNVDAANAQTVELTLKTADAEIAAGTVSGISKTSAVTDILVKYGVSGIDVTKEGQSKAHYRYKDKAVICDPNRDKDSDGTAITDKTTLEDILP